MIEGRIVVNFLLRGIGDTSSVGIALQLIVPTAMRKERRDNVRNQRPYTMAGAQKFLKMQTSGLAKRQRPKKMHWPLSHDDTLIIWPGSWC